ncbi:acyltransferase family protein [Kitasatospora sp. NBC_00315]|uniref:acyltransferase family protein n=1 Tax=Kitasatospora sp. NBC_00315 TaxID=2975963 RepID=UPI00324F1417
MNRNRRWLPRATAGSAQVPSTVGRAAARLGWLDALRGLAALTVAMHHFNLLGMLPFGGFVWWHFDPGLYGVMLFFVVSGYIIPASLERRGDIRAFWVGRIFRIYPAMIAALALSIMILPSGDGSVALLRTGHNLISLVANGIMLQDLLGVINSMNVTWTLCYEMVFYYFVTALFSLGWHRRSGPIAVGSATVALVLGTAIAPMTLTTDLSSTRNLVLAAAVIVAMGLACMLSGNRTLTRTGALLLAGLGLVLVVFNSRAPSFETWMIFATMFAGTAVYRAEHGQIDRMQAAFCCGFVIVAGVLVGWMYNRDGMQQNTWTAGWVAWSAAYFGAWATFGVGLMLRRRRFPRVLTWLGAVSFSVYLLHIPLLHTLAPRLHVPPVPHTAGGKVLWTAEFLAVVLLVSYLLYRLVELPMQKLGRRVLKAVERGLPAVAAGPGPGGSRSGPDGTASDGAGASAARPGGSRPGDPQPGGTAVLPAQPGPERAGDVTAGSR